MSSWYFSKEKNFIPKHKKDNIRTYPTELARQNLAGLVVNSITPRNAPIENSIVRISSPSSPDQIIEEVTTDINGQTPEIELPAPPVDYSLAPTEEQPYAEYNISITAPGFNPVRIDNAQLFSSVTALQEATLDPVEQATGRHYVIPPHTLFGEFPPKIAEPEIKTVAETGEIVLTNVVIPEFVVVHDGAPTDTTASNYYVRFRDFIKNVASNEIYSTWPEPTLQANILAILSFTLNRVFTEWYRNQGFNFTITSSTAFDQKWAPGRNIYTNIGVLVDQLFVNYLSRPNIIQPILTQYCDGNRIQCPDWLSQWGSKELGDQGYEAIEILRNYYGDSIYIDTAPEVSGVPSSWPGTNLTIGSTGPSVRTIQQQLNTIAEVYTAIPLIAEDGIFGPQTSNAVRTFQKIFNMPQSGIVDFPTWYRISGIYVAITRIAE